MNLSKKVTPSYIALAIVVIVVITITSQNILLSDFGYENSIESFYNNFLIFRNSHFHLLTNQNLFIHYPEIQDDLFKYSPTFALVFGVFAYFPDFIGLFLWNLLNGLVFYALWQVKFPRVKNKLWIIGFVLVEFITNIQNSQSNGLMAGLMILAFVFYERKNVALATLMIVLSVYIKIFGLVAFALFLLYPNKWKSIGYGILWMVVLFVLPLVVISPLELMAQYQNWVSMLMQDEAVSYSPSVMGWLKTWFHINPSAGLVLGLGVLIFLAPLIQFKKYDGAKFRQLILASILIWVVIFNHKAESPTFIIAVSGVAVWFFSQKQSRLNMVLLLITLIFTQLSPTDLFPPSIKEAFLYKYVIKVVPILLVWIKILYDAFIGVQNEELKELEEKPTSN